MILCGGFVFQAIMSDKPTVDFMGRTIPLTRARFGVFITMNPGTLFVWFITLYFCFADWGINH